MNLVLRPWICGIPSRREPDHNIPPVTQWAYRNHAGDCQGGHPQTYSSGQYPNTVWVRYQHNFWTSDKTLCNAYATAGPVLATWVICSQNRRLQHDLTSPLLAEKREMRVQSIRFALPWCSGNSPIFKKERFILCLVFSSPSNTWYVPAFTCSNMASCIGQDLCWLLSISVPISESKLHAGNPDVIYLMSR